MLGNDVVDLRDPETTPEALHPGFDARVFSTSEREVLRGSPDPHRQRWILWAAKEAAYKAARQGDSRVVFSPARFAVTLDGAGWGRVQLGSQVFAVDLAVGRESVHAIARPWRDSSAVLARLEPLPNPSSDPSTAVRSACRLALARRLDCLPEELEIRRTGRVPKLWVRSAVDGGWRPAELPVSLSHHGRFIAFACVLAEAGPPRSQASIG